MTLQETFDLVVNHLRKQGCKAKAKSLGLTRCFYYTTGPNPLKCAAGCLIPPSKYDPLMEGKDIYIDGDEFLGLSTVGLALKEEGHDPTFVRDLQIIHDSATVEDWEMEFNCLAKRYNLVYTPV